jgi:orotidine-5'-phosphate decarboxylase
MSFREKWLEAVERKNSVLCAGLDPAEFGMGRGEKGLPEGESKFHWALRYIQAVAPFCAAVKPNIQYWKDAQDNGKLDNLRYEAKDLGLIFIEDSKLADIGSTNDAGLFYAAQKGMDAVTFSPFAGNLKEAVDMAHARDLGLISMVLMSNPEYGGEKNKLVPVREGQRSYGVRDEVLVEGEAYVKQYIQLAHDAEEHGLDGIVIGAPSSGNHISEDEIERVRSYVGYDKLVLQPGVGTQGGEADIIWKYFGSDNVIVSVSREMMLPNGSNSTPEEQAAKAKRYQEMLNGQRKAA